MPAWLWVHVNINTVNLGPAWAVRDLVFFFFFNGRENTFPYLLLSHIIYHFRVVAAFLKYFKVAKDFASASWVLALWVSVPMCALRAFYLFILSILYFLKDFYLFYFYEYTVAVFRHIRREHQIPLEIVVSHHVVAENWTQTSRRASSALNHWAISPAPAISIFKSMCSLGSFCWLCASGSKGPDTQRHGGATQGAVKWFAPGQSQHLKLYMATGENCNFHNTE